MNRTFGIAVAVAVVLGLGLGAGASAWQTGGQPRSVARSTAQANGNGNGAQAQAATSAAQGQGQGGRPVAGTIDQVEGKNVTVQAQSGTVKVTLADNTTYSKVDTAAVADLKAGASVVVVGQQEGDALAATSVQLLGEGESAQVGSGFGGQGAQFGQGNQSASSGQSGQSSARRTRLVGKVRGVDGQSLTVAGSDGTTTKVSIGNTTALQKTTAATVADLKVGVNVIVNGDAAADGTVTARGVQIVPARTGN
ncbi:MAG: DUF5666 domain-containing protein [Chloroflexota bacterium]